MSTTRDQLADDLAKVAAGDVAAFVRVYEATSRKLFGVVVRILGRSDLSDEILQEVYVRVWQRAGDFAREQSSPITWLVTIARNRALDEKRRKVARPLDDVPDYLEIPSNEDIAAEYLEAEDLRRLHACLERLDPARRKLLEVVYFAGLTRDDAGARLGMSPGAIRSSLRASLAELKSCLNHD